MDYNIHSFIRGMWFDRDDIVRVLKEFVGIAANLMAVAFSENRLHFKTMDTMYLKRMGLTIIKQTE